ncbi:MAG: protein kinase [Anaerolineae bacterium]|nr:protein kinase [Anaerolineae bacterium]
MANKMMGHYEIRGKIGQGGMANVFLGYDTNLEREVAIKILETYFARESTFSARFEREAKVITSLEHSYIVPVYDYGHFKGLPYLVMRYMRGGSLKSHLEKGPFTMRQADPIIQRLASALDYAHENGIVHRDLKPDNILFDREDNAFLADFGIVKLAESSTTFTQTGNTLGTPAYMSPEQAKAIEQVDHRSDIYSLGVILYEMLTGDVPYKADTTLGQAMMHVLEPVPRILEANPDLPVVCEDIIQKAMAKDRDDRYATAGALAEALASAIQTGSAKTVETAVVVSTVLPLPKTETATKQSQAVREDRFHLEMSPHELKGKGTVSLLVLNEGDQSSIYTITGRDATGEIQFGITQRRLRVPAGEEKSVDVGIVPPKRQLLGRKQTLPFQIYATPDTSEPQFETGHLQISPTIPLWVLPLLAVLFLAAGTFAFWPPAADNDKDGIANTDEIALGTDPDNPDSDGDGFNDGKEQQQGTNPLDRGDPRPIDLPPTATPTSSYTPTATQTRQAKPTDTPSATYTSKPTDTPTSPPNPSSIVQQITFPPGAISTRVAGSLVSNQLQIYHLWALASQNMRVAMVSGNANLTVISPSGAILHNQKGSYDGTLPQSGDYTIIVDPGSNATNFTLDITIKTPTPTPIPTPTPTPIPPDSGLSPRMWNARFCMSTCLNDGSNAVYSLPANSTQVFVKWEYENVPVGAAYTRSWRSNGDLWVVYDCAWNGPVSGTDEIRLWDREVGLRAGEWEMTVTVNGETVLQDSIIVEGNNNLFLPVSPLVKNSCR